MDVDGLVLRALAHPPLVGQPEVGDTVLLNVGALDLGLGTGGYALVVALPDRLPPDVDGPGHLVKARYTPLQAVVLGVIQGLTEFLPISSSAHLRIFPELFGWGDPGAAFTAVVQIGTELAVLIYFRHDIWRIASMWTRSLFKPELRGHLARARTARRALRDGAGALERERGGVDDGDERACRERRALGGGELEEPPARLRGDDELVRRLEVAVGVRRGIVPTGARQGERATERATEREGRGTHHRSWMPSVVR